MTRFTIQTQQILFFACACTKIVIILLYNAYHFKSCVIHRIYLIGYGNGRPSTPAIKFSAARIAIFVRVATLALPMCGKMTSLSRGMSGEKSGLSRGRGSGVVTSRPVYKLVFVQYTPSLSLWSVDQSQNSHLQRRLFLFSVLQQELLDPPQDHDSHWSELQWASCVPRHPYLSIRV